VRAVDAGDAPFRKVSCDELLSSGVKQVRMLAAAAGGVAVPAGRAGAVLVGDVPLELYGFCVGSGFAVERVEPASCVVVSVRDADARRYLDSRLAAAEFVAGVDYEVDGAVYTMWRAALVQACLSTPADAFADAIVTACDLAALRRLLSGLCGARGTTRHFDTESVRLRDELVRVLLHAGFVATFEPLVVGASWAGACTLATMRSRRSRASPCRASTSARRARGALT
jgi:hypothetical protein